MWQKPEIDCSKSVWISPWQWKVVKPNNFILGNHTDIGSYTVFLCQQGVEIEDDVSIGPFCAILSISTIGGYQGKVTIKRNAKIGSHTTIMPGVIIGENAIIGSHSYVDCEIPPNEFWCGIPAKFKHIINT